MRGHRWREVGAARFSFDFLSNEEATLSAETPGPWRVSGGRAPGPRGQVLGGNGGRSGARAPSLEAREGSMTPQGSAGCNWTQGLTSFKSGFLHVQEG